MKSNMTESFIEAFIKTLPPAHVNNSREIVRKLWAKWESSKSSYFAHKLSKILGTEPDLKDTHGTYNGFVRSKTTPDEFMEIMNHKLPDNIPF